MIHHDHIRDAAAELCNLVEKNASTGEIQLASHTLIEVLGGSKYKHPDTGSAAIYMLALILVRLSPEFTAVEGE
jgi:hypothetical protein